MAVPVMLNLFQHPSFGELLVLIEGAEREAQWTLKQVQGDVLWGARA